MQNILDTQEYSELSRMVSEIPLTKEYIIDTPMNPGKLHTSQEVCRYLLRQAYIQRVVSSKTDLRGLILEVFFPDLSLSTRSMAKLREVAAEGVLSLWCILKGIPEILTPIQESLIRLSENTGSIVGDMVIFHEDVLRKRVDKFGYILDERSAFWDDSDFFENTWRVSGDHQFTIMNEHNLQFLEGILAALQLEQMFLNQDYVKNPS